MQDYVAEGVQIVNGESIQHGNISTENMNYLPESYKEEYSKFILKAGDIVLGLNRPITNGNLKIATVPYQLDGSLLYQRAGRIEYVNDIDSNFSFTFLSNEILKHTLKEAVGSDQPFISTSKLSNWKMILPGNCDEQEKIGSLFKRLDDTIALHHRMCKRRKLW